MADIPVKNLYYIFCYAWQKMDIGQALEVGDDKNLNAYEMFSKVLSRSVRSIIKKGLDKEYLSFDEGLSCPKGKISFTDTVKRNMLSQKRLSCSYDELSLNIIQNQIIKTTLAKLTKTKEVDVEIKQELKALNLKIHNTDTIKVQPSDFRKIKLHRNNAYYDFSLKICELLNSAILPSENGQGYKFSSILNDEKKMELVFESFVRNFYGKEQREYLVKSEKIKWNLTGQEQDTSHLPEMSTDISLSSQKKKIIIDTKYYKEAFQLNYETEKVRSPHLYQLQSYLINNKPQLEEGVELEGMLLYPSVSKEIDLKFNINGFKIRVCTINLNQEWSLIRTDLLSLIGLE